MLEEAILLASVGILVGLSKGGLGGPVPVALTVPLMTFILEPQIAVALVLPLLLFADVFALRLYWRQWDPDSIKRMLPSGLLGLLVGVLVLQDIDALSLKRIIGALTLLALLFKLGSERLAVLRYKPRAWHGAFAGWASGFGSTLANVGAPPFTAYMLLQPGMTPRRFVGTTTLFFAVLNVTKLPSFLLIGIVDSQKLLDIVWVFLFIPPSVILARAVIDRINQRVFEWMLMVPLAVLSAVLLLAPA